MYYEYNTCQKTYVGLCSNSSAVDNVVWLYHHFQIKPIGSDNKNVIITEVCWFSDKCYTAYKNNLYNMNVPRILN